MTLNPINVHGRQSMHEVYMMSSLPFCIHCDVLAGPLQINYSFVLIEWPLYEIGVRADDKAV